MCQRWLSHHSIETVCVYKISMQGVLTAFSHRNVTWPVRALSPPNTCTFNTRTIFKVSFVIFGNGNGEFICSVIFIDPRRKFEFSI